MDTNTLNVTIGSVGIADEVIQNLSVYPNPATDFINIEVSNGDEQEMVIELLTVSGQVVYRQQYKISRDSLVQQIDLSGYAKGVYLLRISQQGAVYNGKIIVM